MFSRLMSPPPPFPSAVRQRADRHSRGLMLMSEEGNAVEGGGGRRCWKGQCENLSSYCIIKRDNVSLVPLKKQP